MNDQPRIESRPLSTLRRWPLNPRLHDLPALHGSLARFGYVNLIIVNSVTGQIVAGHGRLEALEERKARGEPPPARVLVADDGDWLIPVVTLELPSEEADAYALADNRLAELGSWDPAGLMAVLEELDAGAGREGTGFEDEEEVRRLLASLDDGATDGSDGREDHPDVVSKAEELQEKWQVQRGDVWLCGKHRVMCGDATSPDDVAGLIGGDRARLVWTDPPYGVSYGDKLEAANPMGYKVRHIENDNLPPAQLEVFIRSALRNAASSTLPGAAIYVACPAGTLLPVLIAAFAGSGFDFHWGLVWVKDQLVLGRGDYYFKHENILYGWKPDAAHYFVDDRTQTSVFEVDRPKTSEEHPTMKPTALIGAMIHNSSEPGDVVLDMFLGSGSTLIAAEQAGRICYGCEIEPRYVSVVLERYMEFTGGDEPRRLE